MFSLRSWLRQNQIGATSFQIRILPASEVKAGLKMDLHQRHEYFDREVMTSYHAIAAFFLEYSSSTFAKIKACDFDIKFFSGLHVPVIRTSV